MFNLTELVFTPSKILAGVLSLPFIAALLLVIIHDINLVFKLSLCISLGIYGIMFIGHHALLCFDTSVTKLSLTKDSLAIQTRKTKALDGEIIGRSLITRWFCLVSVQHPPLIKTNLPFVEKWLSKSHIIITRLNIENTEQLRRFRVLIKFGKHNPNKLTILT